VIEEVLSGIWRSDVLQPSGKVNLNTGEVAPVGISQLVDAVGFSATDIFVDVGSGTGNVVLQIALESRVPCYGIEIRDELATKSRYEIEKFAEKYPSLRQVNIISDNVSELSPMHFKLLEHCTILYSSNRLFDPVDNLALQDLILSLPNLLTVVLSSPFCSRCGLTCNQNFCLVWKTTTELLVQPTWTKEKIRLYVYNRTNANQGSLIDLVMRM
jgi:hypothetical protein